MVHVLSLLGAAALLSIAHAAPAARPDSAIGDEVAVSAPNGVIESDTAALASQTDSSSGSSTTSDALSSSYGGSYTTPPSYGGSYTTSSEYSVATDSSSYVPPPYASSSVWSSSTWESSSSSMYMPPPSYTSSAYVPPPAATYGSGSSSWGNSYDSCVQQCIASNAPPMGSYTPPTATYGSTGSSGGNGVTHTVYVAPSQGVLRYVPFATNASVGDTVRFIWGAGPHTVTKSSEFSLCNKTSDQPFASGQQNKGFIFDQVVNDTNPTFYYCGVPTHCEKGMFGIINPPSALGTPNAFGSMMDSWSSSNPVMASMMSYTTNQTNSSNAASWGNSIDVSNMIKGNDSTIPALIASNVMYTRLALAANPGSLGPDGKFNPPPPNNMNVPFDVPATLLASSTNNASNSTSADSTSSAATSSSTDSSSTSSSAAAGATSSKSGAVSVTSSRVLVGAAVLAATVFAL